MFYCASSFPLVAFEFTPHYFRFGFDAKIRTRAISRFRGSTLCGEKKIGKLIFARFCDFRKPMDVWKEMLLCLLSLPHVKPIKLPKYRKAKDPHGFIALRTRVFFLDELWKSAGNSNDNNIFSSLSLHFFDSLQAIKTYLFFPSETLLCAYFALVKKQLLKKRMIGKTLKIFSEWNIARKKALKTCWEANNLWVAVANYTLQLSIFKRVSTIWKRRMLSYKYLSG